MIHNILNIELPANIDNAFIGETRMVDVTNLIAGLKAQNLPFTMSFLYHAADAANAVTELRRRIRDGRVIEFDRCMSCHEVQRADGGMSKCVLEVIDGAGEFLPGATFTSMVSRMVQLPPMPDEDPLGVMNMSWKKEERFVELAIEAPADSCPRICWGKYEEENGRITMPVAIHAHCALVTPDCIAQFFAELNSRIGN